MAQDGADGDRAPERLQQSDSGFETRVSKDDRKMDSR